MVDLVRLEILGLEGGSLIPFRIQKISRELAPGFWEISGYPEYSDLLK
jgi:hypothetical protein